MGESLTGHIRSEENPADLCTKIMAGGTKRDRLTEMILFYATPLASYDPEVDAPQDKKRLKRG
jgi:hypothetical protein